MSYPELHGPRPTSANATPVLPLLNRDTVITSSNGKLMTCHIEPARRGHKPDWGANEMAQRAAHHFHGLCKAQSRSATLYPFFACHSAVFASDLLRARRVHFPLEVLFLISIFWLQFMSRVLPLPWCICAAF